jgi:hypothetical protein
VNAPDRCHVVLPLYRDVESFEILRERVRELEGLPPMQFWVVDDSAGRDPDVADLHRHADVSVVVPPFNLGHQRAIVAGLRVASEYLSPGDLVVTMDSDGEDRPEDLPRLVDSLLAEPDPWRIVIARRTERDEQFRFKVLYLCFRLMFRVLTGRKVRSGNFAAFRGTFVHSMLLHPSFDLCYSSSLLTLNADPIAVPCARGKRYAGQSRMGTEKLLMHGIRMLMPFADRIAIRSLALCAVTSAVTALTLFAVLLARLTGAGTIAAGGYWVLLGGVVVSGLGLVNFLVLFSGYVQTNALSLARIDERVVIE